jgi:hypothetical protein
MAARRKALAITSEALANAVSCDLSQACVITRVSAACTSTTFAHNHCSDAVRVSIFSSSMLGELDSRVLLSKTWGPIL